VWHPPTDWLEGITMRDYDNMPTLNWNEAHATQKARAQILRQEPVILQMPDNFNTSLIGEELDCRCDEASGILYDCDAGHLLKRLAEINDWSDLNLIADACIESSSLVDLDSSHKRLIVHD
jgi:hypothetical protein